MTKVNLDKINKCIIFPGPGKTATSWLYLCLLQCKDLEIVGSKDNDDAINDIKKIIKTVKSSKKTTVIFNHELLKVNNFKPFKDLDPQLIVIEREEVSRYLSSIIQHIKEGHKKLSEITDSYIKEVVEHELINKQIILILKKSGLS